MSFCNEVLLTGEHDGVKHAITLPCKAWTCENCLPMRRRNLIESGFAGQPDKFITLTSRRRDGLTPIDAAREIVHAWRVIRRAYSRQHNGLKIEFLAVFEATKEGWPHLHILARSLWIDQRWLSERMEELTNSPIVWIEDCRKKKKIAAYIAKYAGKAPHQFGTVKRYWTSKLWRLRPRSKLLGEYNWSRQISTIYEWCRSQQRLGYWTTILSKDHATAVMLC